MNRINAQINELHEWADQLRERENELGVVVRAHVATLRDAAYTIQQLHDDLQRSLAENVKLCMKISSLESALEGMHLIREMDLAENTELWKLVQEMHATISDRNAWWDCTFKDTKRFADRMRKLRTEC